MDGYFLFVVPWEPPCTALEELGAKFHGGFGKLLWLLNTQEVEAAAMGRFTGAQDGDTVLTSTRAYQLSEEWFTARQIDTGNY